MALAAAALGLGLALIAGAWRSRMATAESVHFSFNVPSAASNAGPGGLGPFGREGYIAVDLARTGLPKRLIQPSLLNLSSHWVRNVGKTPIRLRLEMVEGTRTAASAVRIEWESRERSFDPKTHMLGRPLAPGEEITVDWLLTIPPDANAPVADATGAVIAWQGTLVARDADTAVELSRLPMVVGWGLDAKTVRETCCVP